jgi:hypothetical protein
VYQADPNAAAYLKAIAASECGGYDFKYGAVKGKKNDPWRFTDTSTHPGAGFGGRTTLPACTKSQLTHGASSAAR